MDDGDRFGCKRCWPPAAEVAWEARGGLTPVDELIDESHFGVLMLACPHCAQRFLSVFTERVDWKDSDDPQYWTQLPLTEAEATDLLRDRASLTEAVLDALGPGRRCLRLEHPKGGPRRIVWGSGIGVEPHD
jgi:hypothetical protein